MKTRTPVLAALTLVLLSATASAQAGLTLFDSDIQAQNNDIRDLGTLNPGNNSLRINASTTNLTQNNITGPSNINNFFDQNQCASDEAIKTVLPNGSYVCNSISTTTEAENLSETLQEGNSAGGNSINLSQENLEEVGELNPKGGELVIGSNITIGNSSDTSIAELNRLTDLPLQPTVDSFEDGDLSEYSVRRTGGLGGGSGDEVIQSTTTADGSEALTLTQKEGELTINSSEGLDTYPSADQKFEGRIRINSQNADAGDYGVTWGGPSGTYYELEFDKLPSPNVIVLSSDDSFDSKEVSIPEEEFLRFVVDWKSSGDIDATVFDSSGNLLANLSIQDATYQEGGFGYEVFAAQFAPPQPTVEATYDGFRIIDSGGIEIDSDVQLENSRLSDVNSIDGGGDSLNVNDNLDLNSNNITNFFDQNKCASDEAIKTVLPNGSYVCNSISTTTEAENLSETLAAGNTANQSINLDANNLGNLSELNPSGGNLDLGSNLTLAGSGSLARLNQLTDLPLNPFVDNWDDGDISEYKQNLEADSVTATQTSGINDSSGTELLFEDGFGSSEGSVYRESKFERGDTLTGFVEWTDSGPSDLDFGVGFGVQNESDVGTNLENYDSGYTFEVDYGDNNLAVRKGPSLLAESSLSQNIGLGTPYKFKIDWKSNGTIRGRLFSESGGTKLGEVKTIDLEYDRGIYSVIGGRSYTTDSTSQAFEIDDFRITESDGIDVNADTSFNGNQISDVSRINDFFNQNKCASDEAIKTVLPNGSYVCNTISSTTGKQNLSETLNEGNRAGNNNINLTGNNLTNVDTVKGSSPVRFADNANFTSNNITNVDTIDFGNAGGNILNVDELSLSEGSTDFRLRVGGQIFLDEGFEDGNLGSFTNDGNNDVNWDTTSNTPFGDVAAQSGDTGDAGDSEMSTTVSNGNLVVFKYFLNQTGDESAEDVFVETGSGTQKQLVGTKGGWQTASLEVSPSTTELEFVMRGGTPKFSTPGGSDVTSDFGVDNVRVFNTTENAVTVYGSQSLNTGDLNQVDRVNFVEGIDIGQDSNATRTDAVSIGRNSEASSRGATALGESSTASDFGTTALGESSEASGSGTTALGEDSTASDTSATALGTFSAASDTSATALGTFSTASNFSATALGQDSTASGAGATAVGPFSAASDEDATALGENSEASASGAVAIGRDSVADQQDTVELGSSSQAYDLIVNGQDITFGSTGSNTDTRINNFFDQNKCGDNEAIKTVYPNGSYACNSISTTTEAENLSETLQAGNIANQTIDLDDNGIKDASYVSARELNSSTELYDFEDSQGLNGTSAYTVRNDTSIAATTDVVEKDSSELRFKVSSLVDGRFIETYLNLTNIDDIGVGDRLQLEQSQDDYVLGFSDQAIAKVQTTTGKDILQLRARQSFETDPNGLVTVDAPNTDNFRQLDLGEIEPGKDVQWDIRFLGNGSARVTASNVVSGPNTGYIDYNKTLLQKKTNMLVGVFTSSGGPNKFYYDNVRHSSALKLSSSFIEVNGSVDMSGSELVSFFNSTACGPNEAVRRVYANGSYKCTSIPEDTGAENLSETLSAGKKAGNNNINLTGNNITNVDTVKGSSPVKFADNINLTQKNITDVGNINFGNAGGDILNVDQLSLSQGSSDFRLRVGGKKFLDEDFEDGSLAPFENSAGNANSWSIDSETEFGEFAASSPITTGDESDVLKVDVSGGTVATFRYRTVNGGIGLDEAFFQTESKKVELQETGGEWRLARVSLSPGSKTLEWNSTRTFFNPADNQKLYIDSVKVFNQTRKAISVLGTQTMNAGDLLAVDKIETVQGVEIGNGANASDGSVALGRDADATTGVAIKGSSVNDSSVAIDGRADARDAVSLGGRASGAESIAIGSSDANAEDAIAIGASVDEPNTAKIGRETDLKVTKNLDVSGSADVGDTLTINTSGSDFDIVGKNYNDFAQDLKIKAPNEPTTSGAAGDLVLEGGSDFAGVVGDVIVNSEALRLKNNRLVGGPEGSPGSLEIEPSIAVGANSIQGLQDGDINASDIYYDSTIAKSPVVSCSQGSDWCSVSVPENQTSFFVKKGEDFDKDRPRKTAEEIVESDVETVEELEKLRSENERQEERIESLNETVEGLKSVICEDNPRAEVCG